MLIEFAVENFRSIRERQVFSMVATSRLKKKENTVPAGIDGEKFPNLLKVAAIYGPNASGKSTIIEAFSSLRMMVRRNPSNDATQLPASPFKFDPVLRQRPSVFEVNFVIGGIRYNFVLRFSEERVYEESLTEYIRGKEFLLYSRRYDGFNESYEFGATLEGGEVLHTAWRQLTGSKFLFLSQAVANSSEELKQLRLPFSWLSNLIIEGTDRRFSTEFTMRMLADVPSLSNELVELLCDVDVPVTSIKAEVESTSREGGDSVALRELIKDRDSFTNDKKLKAWLDKFRSGKLNTVFVHKTDLGDAEFSLDEESDGTKNLLSFAVPLYMLWKHDDSLKASVAIVDELDSSLHPRVVEELVRRHVGSGKSRQLIFSTHDTHLMDTKLLRRDQLWLTERDRFGATQLRSVHDFQGREDEDVEKRYYEGRYRGLPHITGS